MGQPSGHDGDDVRLRVLGPVELLIGGVSTDFGGPKQRALLVMLALEAGSVVPVDRLIDGIWGERPPETVRSSVYVYVAELRRVFASCGLGHLIQTRQPGYLLATTRPCVDVLEFEAIVDAIHRLDGSSGREQSVLAREALAMWFGEALGGLDGVEFCQSLRARLDAQRLDVTELLLGSEVASGHHDAVIAELEELTVRHPYRERLWELLVLALYRGGRQVEALKRVSQLRRVLADELGLQVGPPIAALEVSVLQHDPTLSVAAHPTLNRNQVTATNLRRSITSLIGVADQLCAVGELVRTRRLLTLTGPGGVGKTRLATEVGWACLDEFVDGVWLVDLATLSDPSLVALKFASTWTITPQAHLSALDATIEWLVDKSLLVIVDNCEHVLNDAATVIAEIMERCPAVTVLATSRERLGVHGERCCTVHPLDPATHGAEMFVDRARAVDPSYGEGEQWTVIAEICRQLDGLPLAIELAAARTAALSPQQLLDRIVDRFALLKGSERGAAGRHMSLLATVAWSYQLLNDHERTVFDRMSVFADGFDLDSLEHVCFDASQASQASSVVDVIESLVTKSMVVALPAAGGTRFHLLETMRQFGHDRLAASGALAAIRDRHLSFFIHAADRFDELTSGPNQVAGHLRFRDEWGNLRVAYAWAIAKRESSSCLALLRSCYLFAHCAMVLEFGEWAERALTLDTDEQPLSAELFGFAGEYAQTVADDRLSFERSEAGVLRARGSDDPAAARCWWLGTFSGPTRDLELSEMECYRNLRRAISKMPDLERTWCALVDLVDASIRIDPTECPADIERLTQLAERVGAPALLTYAALFRGHGMLLQKPPDLGQARVGYAEALAVALSVGDVRGEGMARRGVALVSAGLEEPDRLLRCHEAIVLLYRTRYWQKLWQVLDSTVMVLMAMGECEEAAIIAGHLDQHVPAVGMEQVLGFRAAAMSRISEHPRASEWRRRGASLGRDEVVALALAATSP